MPASQRQQLQDIVRASVAQDHNAMQTKSVTPSLEIKLPASAEGIKEKDSLASTKSHSLDSTVEENDEEEDDWDTFQSFPASSSATATDPQIGSTPEEGDIIENSEFEKYTGDGEDIKLASGDMEALSNMVQKEVVTEVVSDVVGEKNIMGECLDLLREDNVDEPFDRQHGIDKVVPGEEKELTEVQLSECFEASDESNFVEGQRLRNDSTSDRADLEISPAAAPVELLDIGKHCDGGGLKDTDPVVNANEDTEKETPGEKRNNQQYAGQDSFLVKDPDTSHSSEEEVIQLQPSEHSEESNESNIGESHRLREDGTSPIGLEVSSVTTSSKLRDIVPHNDVGGVTTDNLDVPVNGDSVNQILDGESRNEKHQDVGHC